MTCTILLILWIILSTAVSVYLHWRIKELMKKKEKEWDGTNAPEKLFCWNFQTKKGSWEKGWGGYSRATNLTPMDERERNTGALYIRADLARIKDAKP